METTITQIKSIAFMIDKFELQTREHKKGQQKDTNRLIEYKKLNCKSRKNKKFLLEEKFWK